MTQATLKSLFAIRDDCRFHDGTSEPGTYSPDAQSSTSTVSNEQANFAGRPAAPPGTGPNRPSHDLDPSLPYLVIPGVSPRASVSAQCNASTAADPTRPQLPHGTTPSPSRLVITRGDMHELACTLGGVLVASGTLSPVGDRVALVMPNGAEYVASLYGITFARAVCVPLNPTFTGDELQFYLSANRVRLALVAAGASNKSTLLLVCQQLGISVWSVAVDIGQQPCQGTAQGGPVARRGTATFPSPDPTPPSPRSPRDDDPQVAGDGQVSREDSLHQETVRGDSGCRAPGREAPQLNVTWEQGPAQVAAISNVAARDVLSRRPPPDGDDVALILHTSGTTGAPKCVPLRHRQLVWRALAATRMFQLSQADACMMVAPLFHVLGLGLGLLTPLASGGAVMVTPGFDVDSFFDVVAAEKVTWVPAAPTIHRAVLAAALARPDKVWPRGQVRMLVTGGAPMLRRELAELERVLHTCVISIYGLSETSTVASTRYRPPLDGPEEGGNGVGATRGGGRGNDGKAGQDGSSTSQGAHEHQRADGGRNTHGHQSAPSEARLLTDANAVDSADLDGDAPAIVGVPFYGVELALLDDAGARVKGDVDHPGEVCVRGPGIFDGYEDAPPELDADCFHPAHAGREAPDGDREAGGGSQDKESLARASCSGHEKGLKYAAAAHGHVSLLASGAPMSTDGVRRGACHEGAQPSSQSHALSSSQPSCPLDSRSSSLPSPQPLNPSRSPSSSHPAANLSHLRWFRSGDLGYLDANRDLVICGRRSDFINKGGMKVNPSEVERVIKQHPAVADAAAFPLEDPLYGQVVAACVVLADATGGAAGDAGPNGGAEDSCGRSLQTGQTDSRVAGAGRGCSPGQGDVSTGEQLHGRLTHNDLRAHCSTHLATYKLPGSFFVTSSLPTNAAGKVLRRQLAQMASDGSLARLPWDVRSGGGDAPVAPRTALERRVAAIWQRALGLSCVSVVDHFLHLGGHSLNAARLMQQMKDADPELAEALLRGRDGQGGGSGGADGSALMELSTVEQMACAAEVAMAGKQPGTAATGARDGAAKGKRTPWSEPQDRVWFLSGLAGDDDGSGGGQNAWQHAGVSLALANAQLLWSYAVVAMHFGHCGGQNLRCEWLLSPVTRHRGGGGRCAGCVGMVPPCMYVFAFVPCPTALEPCQLPTCRSVFSLPFFLAIHCPLACLGTMGNGCFKLPFQRRMAVLNSGCRIT
eukprot:jgi/Mesvir1/8198/Mv12492-RA.2